MTCCTSVSACAMLYTVCPQNIFGLLVLWLKDFWFNFAKSVLQIFPVISIGKMIILSYCCCIIKAKNIANVSVLWYYKIKMFAIQNSKRKSLCFYKNLISLEACISKLSKISMKVVHFKFCF